MNNYFDELGRLHHKPVTTENPVPSGNGWLYTAYYKKVIGISVTAFQKLHTAFLKCQVYSSISADRPSFYLVRSPGKDAPPISRDEILGLAALGLLQKEHIKGWNFSPYIVPKFNLVSFLKQAYVLRPTFKPVVIGPVEPDSKVFFGLYLRHRNYVWKNDLNQLYRFAFSVPLVDRAFILEKWGKNQLFYSIVAKLDSFGKASGIRFLKYGGEKNKKVMLKEFPSDSPINK